LFFKDNPVTSNNPEPEELAESGYPWQARNELMRNSDEYKDYLLRELNENKKEEETPQPLECDIEEAMKTGIYISGTTGTGKSDIGMYITEMMMSNSIIVFVVDGSQDWIQKK
jgi:hypothetical protein